VSIDPEERRLAQLEGFVKHCDNEVRQARYALEQAEANYQRACQTLQTYQEELGRSGLDD